MIEIHKKIFSLKREWPRVSIKWLNGVLHQMQIKLQRDWGEASSMDI